jgi:hypothetical protein
VRGNRRGASFMAAGTLRAIDRHHGCDCFYCGMEPMTEFNKVMGEVRDLVSKNRSTCLWFTREDYLPENASQAIMCLDKIQRHGTRDAYIRARRLREWLLRNSQREILSVISQSRIAAGESYIAGGTALNLLLKQPRISRDIGIFHDTREAVSRT